METKNDETHEHPQPADRKQDPKLPPASETWVEGQPTSDADYQEPEPPKS
jgi:hypothetical protein